MEDANPMRLTRDQKKELLLAIIKTLRDPAATAAPVHPVEKHRYQITPESRAVLDFFDKDIDISDVFICSECSEIRGSWKSHGEVFRQRCQCEESTLSEPDEAWFAFDFNKLVELCYCCGSELVVSGFESSVWFCGECRQRVVALNDEYGRCVIPMGRFDQNDAVATLKSWTRLIVQDNLRVRRFVEGDAVPLGTYLEAVAAQPVDKPRAFDRFYGLLRPNADGIRSNILTAAGARGENHHSGKSQCREPD